MHANGTQIFVVHRRDRLARQVLRVAKDLLDVIDGRDRRPDLFEGGQNRVKIAFGDPSSYNGVDRLHMTHAIEVGLESGVARSLGAAGQLERSANDAGRRCRKRNPTAVASPVGVARRIVDGAIAGAVWAT